MNINLKILDLQINYLKETLYVLLKCKELTNQDVVKCSEKLDKLILEYERLRNIDQFSI
ncbi:aspartyl-phosphate phosphatase Spo0E family protein [Clostridium muellerianum]|nr:aspartyl-phosphate phosphatase Spo0E family protein [Clostridium muellerianum]